MADYAIQLSVKRYSPATCKTYSWMFREFLRYIYPKSIHQLTRHDILTFQSYLVATKKVSHSYQNQSINSIKFYLEKVLGHERQLFELERPRKERKLPVVLSHKEVANCLECCTNVKHKAIIATIYAAGLRVGELLNLKLADIDSNAGRIWIRGGKGKKDRFSLLPDNLLKLLRRYYMLYRPKTYLFEGPDGGPYSRSSINKIIKRTAKRAGVLKNITAHTFRHSFATHLMERGINLRYIQQLLGHNSAKTTEIYTHICSGHLDEVKSPLHSMKI